MLDRVYNIAFLIILIVLALMTLFCFVKVLKGPKIADRIVAINMIGTLSILMITILAVYLGENGLLDVSLIYAMVSFLAVIVLTRVYTGVYLSKHRNKQEK